jgi:hypothetical protein
MLTTHTGIDELVKATYFDFLEYEKVLFASVPDSWLVNSCVSYTVTPICKVSIMFFLHI